MREFELLSLNAKKALQIANREAIGYNHPAVAPEHIAIGLASLADCVTDDALEALGISLESVRFEVDKLVSHGDGDTAQSGLLPLTPRSKKIIQLAQRIAAGMGMMQVDAEHLLLAIIREGENNGARAFANLGVDYDKCFEQVRNALENSSMSSDESEDGAPPGTPLRDEDDEDDPGIPGEQKNTDGISPDSQMPPFMKVNGEKASTPALRAFGRDLTEMAEHGSLDPMIGRRAELERIIQILSRRNKNNAALLGEAGVGKTAVVEGLAQAIAAGTVPDTIAGKRVVALDLTLVVAGTKYRGEFEKRMKAIVDDIRRAGNIILFIDEIHSIVGAGDSGGSMDAANIFKPALARGELQCIGATTLDEYRKYIEKDAALERRFQTVRIEEPTVGEAIEILNGIKSRYEDFHKVRYTDDAIEAAVRLSARYQTGRFLPDKAIDVLDEAGARVHIAATELPEEIRRSEEEVRRLNKLKNEAIEKQDFEKAVVYRDTLRSISKQVEESREAWEKTHSTEKAPVTSEDMAATLSSTTGIPLRQMTEDEQTKLLELEKELSSAVIGQEDAVSTVCRALRRSRAGLKDPRRPIGAFLFLGPTGVGKTLLARTIATRFFGDEKSFIQFDMSEFMDKFTVSRLVGSPPGYVGYDEGGQLTERVRRRPYSVVLFDEVEKAHPDVMHILLQILEEGHLTDSTGRRVDFRNTVVILTSNLGVDTARGGQSFGFTSDAHDAEADSKRLKTRMLDSAKEIFKPELMNRFDNVVFFRKLGKDDLRRIFSLELKTALVSLASRGFKLEVADSAVDAVISGSDETMGARPLRRAIEQLIEDPLAEKIIAGQFTPPCTILVTADNEAVKDRSGLIFARKDDPSK